MIKGNYKNKVVFVPAYVMHDKIWRWEQESQERAQNVMDLVLNEIPCPEGTEKLNYAHNAMAACPVLVVGAVSILAGTVYFAWVPLTDGHKILVEFTEKDLYATAICAAVEHFAHEDRTAREIKRTEQRRAVLYRYARCYHHPEKQGLFVRVKNFLAKKHQASALQLPARPENTPGGNTQPARLLGRGQL